MKKLFSLVIPFIIISASNVSCAIESVSGLTEEVFNAKPGPVITIGYLFQVFFSLLIVIGLIWLVAKYILPKMDFKTRGRLIEVVDKVGLEPQLSAYILRVGKKSWLIAASGKNVEVVSQLEESDIDSDV